MSALSVWWVENEARTHGLSYYDPGEYGADCGVYVAETRGQAKAMHVAACNGDLPDDFLYARTRRLGVPNRREARPGRLGDRSRWWGRVEDSCWPKDEIAGATL